MLPLPLRSRLRLRSRLTSLLFDFSRFGDGERRRRSRDRERVRELCGCGFERSRSRERERCRRDSRDFDRRCVDDLEEEWCLELVTFLSIDFVRLASSISSIISSSHVVRLSCLTLVLLTGGGVRRLEWRGDLLFSRRDLLELERS